LKSELKEVNASLSEMKREREEMITAEMSNSHADTMIKLLKQERDDLHKRL